VRVWMRQCAGYVVRFPFIRHDAFRRLSEHDVNLYKYMFAPDLQPQTLAVIGCIDPLGPNPPVMEMQCRLAARVFKVRYSAAKSLQQAAVVNHS